jgi:demethylmenaquinone methyltransferase/2-methoxy-6-polyprenyl-1,4-benzoquinol methylase
MKKRSEGTSFTRKKYNQNSKFYNLIEFPIEFLLYRHWRKKLFDKVKGPLVLEVGIGTGKNLKFYNNYRAVGIDLSEGMLSKARSIAEEKGVNLIQMDAQNLAFFSNAFDTVITTFVFCSVPDPVKGLIEIKRVLKPNGQALFLEHVLPKNKILSYVFNKFNPFIKVLTGVNINRKTADNIRSAGFEIIKEENLLFSIFKFFIAKPV